MAFNKEDFLIVQDIYEKQDCEYLMCPDCPISTINWKENPLICSDYPNEADKAKDWIQHYQTTIMIKELMKS